MPAIKPTGNIVARPPRKVRILAYLARNADHRALRCEQKLLAVHAWRACDKFPVPGAWQSQPALYNRKHTNTSMSGQMEALSPRQADIVALVKHCGRVSVDDLAERFAVSPQTIRKDLNDICERRLAQRVHGGAVVSSGVENVGYEARRALASEEKRLIGLKAASLIPDNSSLFINIGTTTEQVAEALLDHNGLLVITNNINVANLLHRASGIEVIVTGGPVRRGDGGIVGEATVDFIRQFKVDNAVIGVSAIDADGALLDYDYHEVRVAQEIIENSRHVILVADRMKMERSAPVRIGHISQIGTFVTDSKPHDDLAEICERGDVRLEIADPDGRQYQSSQICA